LTILLVYSTNTIDNRSGKPCQQLLRITVQILKPAVSILVFASMIVGCSTLGFREPDNRWANYKSWTKITEGRPTIGDPTGYLGTRHLGREGYKDVYVNDIGEAVLTSNGPYLFPVGTVLVKEQYADVNAWLEQKKPGITVSVKVGNESSRSNWNWADGYRSVAKESLLCMGCHSHAYADDFVFTNERFLASQQQ
jgi:hypothetical protein